MTDSQNQERSPEAMLRDLEQDNPTAANELAREIEQAGAALGQAIDVAEEIEQPTFEERVREAGDMLAPSVVEPVRDLPETDLGELSPDGRSMDEPWSWQEIIETQSYEPPEVWPEWEIPVDETAMEQETIDANMERDGWLQEVAEQPEPAPEDSMGLERGEDEPER